MANITINNVTKKYGEVTALSDVSFEVKDKEFVVLFGPSGAGKTTLLSLISGIIDSDKGSIEFNGEVVDAIPPNKRNVAMVFENYALYPHFTVYDNIAFPLRSPEYKTEEDKIKKAIDSITIKMNINNLLHRLPYQLSNGQRQRVALGRALVRNPNVFLMDEPLAHLDAKLKNAMRTELKAIQQELDTTTIYVTHDYLEALSLADKVVVVNLGKVIQVATPHKIYYEPANTFVAKLVGEPEINLYTCKFDNEKVYFPDSDITCNISQGAYKELSNQKQESVTVGIRGVDIKVSLESQKDFCEGIIKDFHSIGNRYVVEIGYQDLLCSTLISGHSVLRIDQKIYFKFQSDILVFFDANNENFITRNEGAL